MKIKIIYAATIFVVAAIFAANGSVFFDKTSTPMLTLNSVEALADGEGYTSPWDQYKDSLIGYEMKSTACTYDATLTDVKCESTPQDIQCRAQDEHRVSCPSSSPTGSGTSGSGNAGTNNDGTISITLTNGSTTLSTTTTTNLTCLHYGHSWNTVTGQCRRCDERIDPCLIGGHVYTATNHPRCTRCGKFKCQITGDHHYSNFICFVCGVRQPGY